MTQTLQAVRYPHLVLDEMLRIGRECIITFPNFGNWRCRLHLAGKGGCRCRASCPTPGTTRRTSTSAPCRLRGAVPGKEHPRRFDDEELFHFELEVTPAGSDRGYPLRFDQQLFIE
jgi:hypothetical protein